MKTVLLSLFIATMFASCEKENEHKNLCPVISNEKVPAVVQNSFNTKYPHAIVYKWFYKDNSVYCVSFIADSKKSLSTFNKDGLFVKEESESEQDGNDERDDDTGCECETGD